MVCCDTGASGALGSRDNKPSERVKSHGGEIRKKPFAHPFAHWFFHRADGKTIDFWGDELASSFTTLR